MVTEIATSSETKDNPTPDRWSLIVAAFHEMGHVVMNLHNNEAVRDASIIPNDYSLGRVRYYDDMREPLSPREVVPNSDEKLEEYTELAESYVKTLIGGCVAVQLFQYALSSEAPTRIRMDRFEPGQFELERFQPDWSAGGSHDREKAYKYLAAVGKAEAAADERIDKLWVEVALTLRANFESLLTLSTELLERKEMTGPEIRRYVREYRLPLFRTKVTWLEGGISVDKEAFTQRDYPA